MNNLPEREFHTIVAGGVALAANASFINVVSMAGVTVSHVTGSVSRVAISAVQQDWETFLLVVSIIVSFTFGSFMAGFIVGDNRFKLGANYGITLCIESAALFTSFMFLRRELVLGEWAAAFACGLQNAMVTSYSGLAVRTTHMTGIATDVGNILGQACRSDTKAELWRLKVHVPILFGFIAGGMCGQIAWLSIHEYSLLVPCIFTGGVAALYLTLPFIKDAAEQIKHALPHELHFMDNYEGDPRKYQEYHKEQLLKQVDHYAKITGKNVDDEIRRFLNDMVGNDEIEMGVLNSVSISSTGKRDSGSSRLLSSRRGQSAYGATDEDDDLPKQINI
ncbi:hypothetical protein BATDEDRAFT_23779 [Batrachochytrium dendrobatidis JAM81]|uniref:Uncharacterized protein n=1 Tax=Batrachochytrium dendrobatidis (strain JAM81 / FGSC 10211) TaxID=684364 RepID=F4P063_BATDJ|nr:uncharacterized protein BATDEDRAFT_23779 [Batrachochytrium dendrobatidis JAM81]EGF81386.1 hypothetical protein BATDEDRAFT_23779 [Batrachochytrium dendrobatidis JAM81]|eukprot:XP_006677831.1 hypothetical protein BATDEDRAFT_23779 [Batrachochytrium dendrobatidis JAM81]